MRKDLNLALMAIVLSTVIFSDRLLAEPNARAFAGVFKALPENMFLEGKIPSQAKIDLGKKLYLETALSKNKDLSCNSCHKIDSYGVDNKPTSDGTNGQKGTRNSPTSFNAAIHIAQFWDGRAKDVEEQALGPILNPVEMSMSSDSEVVDRIAATPEYVAMFKTVYPDQSNPISYKNIGDAIGAFERTLVTPSRFDKFLEGSDGALTKEEQEGMVVFAQTGCITCHNGVGIGGGMYQKLGLVKPYQTTDLGRYEVTKLESDKYVFKVPSLRNIEKTAPYFHDGSITKLEDAVKLMASHQLGKELSSKEVGKIVTFLKSLTGDLKKEAVPGAPKL